MRVLYITSAELGRPDAPASRAKGLAAALARRGMRVHLIGTEPAPSLPLPGVTLECLPRPRTRKIGALVWHAALLRRLAGCVRESFDVVLMREIPFTPEPPLFAGARALPLVLEVNGVTQGPGMKPTPLAPAFYTFNYRAAARIVVLTEGLGHYLEREFRVPPDRLRIIPNAADTTRFFPVPRAEARRTMGLPENAFCVVYMGSYHPQQGVDVVLPLCDSLRNRIPGILFVMTGEGPARDALKAEVEKRGLSPSFRFVGAVPDGDLASCVSAADVAFSPIRPEEAWRTEVTFPQKIVEYLACGTPVLAVGYSHAQRRILEEGGAGTLIDPGTGHVERLAETLSAWHKNADMRVERGRRGLDLVRARFSYDAIAAEFEDLFWSL